MSRRNVLVTRAMGGIGDMLMMTPGLHALRQVLEDEQVHFAIPRAYFPVFATNEDVVLLDIERDAIDVGAYRAWHNLSDCPAARYESRTAPRVKRNRADLFARAMGLDSRTVRRMSHRIRYAVTEEERESARRYWSVHGLDAGPVVGVQYRTADSYRDYPHMLESLEALARHWRVLLFHGEPIAERLPSGVVPVVSLPVRQAFALAEACSLIVSPDSAFIHLAAAFDLPCVGLFGPTDGRTVTLHYERCRVLDVRNELGCIACWRNEVMPCLLTGRMRSPCMTAIPVEDLLANVTGLLAAADRCGASAGVDTVGA